MDLVTQNKTEQNEPLVSAIKLDAGSRYQTGTMKITAKGQLVIQQVVLNRGSCSIIADKVTWNNGQPNYNAPAVIGLPQALEFGEQFSVQYPIGCNVIEAEIKTDKGSWTLTWN